MSTLELKTDLHNLIDQVDDMSILKALHTLLRKQPGKRIVGYSSEKKALTKKKLIELIEKAEKDIKNGNFVSIDELEIESENW